MLVEFEKELIETIKEVCKNTSPYLGELENKDESYLRERLLTMYANPAINYLAAQ